MQRFLIDILNDPPYNLTRFANWLLLVCAVLVGSIFLLHTENDDITLNLSFGSEEEVFIQGDAQLAKQAVAKLYPLVKVGQDLEKGDTLFATISNEQYKEMNEWVELLNQGKLIPTKVMLDKYQLTTDIRQKMIDLAKQDAAFRRSSSNDFNLEDADRTIRVKEQIAQLEQEVRDLEKSIPLFEALVKTKVAKYFNERERYERDEIDLVQLKREKEKELEAKRNVTLRREQLKTAKGELYEYNSELAYLTKAKNKPKKKVKHDLVPFEQDLSRSIVSFLNGQIVLSQLSGKVASIGKLDYVQEKDTLIILEGKMEKSNRSRTIVADAAKTAVRKQISVNSASNIILKDGSSIKGTIVEFEDDPQSGDSVVRIDAEEEISYADIEEIIVPSKNTNFLEKVLQNF